MRDKLLALGKTRMLFKPETRERAPEVRVIISTPGCMVATTMGTKRRKEIVNSGCSQEDTLVEEKVPNEWI